MTTTATIQHALWGKQAACGRHRRFSVEPRGNAPLRRSPGHWAPSAVHWWGPDFWPQSAPYRFAGTIWT